MRYQLKTFSLVLLIDQLSLKLPNTNYKEDFPHYKNKLEPSFKAKLVVAKSQVLKILYHKEQKAD